MKTCFKYLPLLCFLLLYAGSLTAVRPVFDFSNIHVGNGMSSNWVTALCRDSDGVMWLGTNRGLNRFNGYQITVFEHEPDNPASLNDSYISCLAQDHEANLWVGTLYGLSIKPIDSNDFRQIDLFEHNAFQCNDINNITDIFIAADSTAYIGTHEGFFTSKEGRFIHHLIDSARFDLAVNHVMAFAEDRAGNIWAGTATRELVRYSPQTGRLEQVTLPNFQGGKYVNRVQRLFVDSENLLWVGTQTGLFVFDLENHSWHPELNRLLFSQIGHNFITGIQEDQQGTIWLTTDGAGVFLFRKREGTLQNIVYSNSNSNSISTNGLFCLLIDTEQIVWLGTYKQGLDFYKPDSKAFRLYKNDPETQNSLSLNDVNCCLEDVQGNIWIGTSGGGINVLDAEKGTFSYYTVKDGLSSDIVVSLHEDRNRNIWIGTYFGGLNRFDPRTGKFSVFMHDVKDSTSLSDDRIWTITEDGKQNLWIGTLGGGLNWFDPQKKSFKRYTSENSDLVGNYVKHLSVDQNNRLWVVTTDGVSLYDPVRDNFESYINKDSARGDKAFGTLFSSFHDSRGWHWLCSEKGLIKFNPANNTMVRIDQERGLQSDPVYRIEEDHLGNLWVSSSHGISKIWFTQIENDTTFLANFLHFDDTDGLQGREFSETASLKARDGTLYFGGINGLNYFNPGEIDIDRSVPLLMFTNLRIFNTVVEPGQEFNKRVILEKPIHHTPEIVLKHSENLFSVEFAALTYLFPGKNKYRYQLEGFDPGWFETDGTTNSVTFTNLNNGDYVLHLKGANADGTWNNEGISLKIKVLPPFWKSWYAMLGYILVLSGLLMGLRYLILFRERMKVQLNMEREEARRVHELDLAKLKFFTNISHEFRTPLALILSPVEKLLPRFKNQPEEKYLHHIYQNSRRLLQLINQLLDFRKLDAQGLVYNPSWGDVVAFVAETVSAFNDLSENKQVELRLVTNLRELYTSFDKDKLEKILFNLLSNAFKFTPVSGTVIVQLNLEGGNAQENESSKKLVIQVKDNGVGIHPSNLEKIFTRFYQEDNTKSTRINGTGIGLSLTKEYVNLHGGDIKVESALNIGSCFSVYLPVTGDGNFNSPHYHGKLMETRFNNLARSGPGVRSGPAVANKEKPVLLVVEDHDELRHYLRENMECQYGIMEAEHGRQALALLEKKLPDLILSDIMMPEMDGIELCRAVKASKITCHIPFIFLIAKTSEQQTMEGLQTGADDYLEKPFNLDILQTKIRNLIRLKENIREVFRNKLEIGPKDVSITSLDEQFMGKVLEIIENQMADVNFSVAKLSRQLGVSRMQLYNKLSSLTGHSPLEFIRIMRLKRAAQLLNNSQMNVSEVAYQVGFNDPKYFSIQFKKEFHVLPSKDRQSVPVS